MRKTYSYYLKTYIINQWSGIEIYETDGKYLKGCSAEGHISHVYADRMSSRPRTWSDDGIDKMSRLRTFKSNGGKVYDELIKSKKINTKLKKYDKIIARNIKKDVVDLTEMRIPVIKNGTRTGTRELLKNILYA